MKVRFTLITMVAIIMLLGVFSFAMAQTTGDPIDWGSLGVNVGVVTAIVAITQVIKNFIPKKTVVWVPIALAIGAFFLTGGAADGNYENVIYWAAAAAYMWKIANAVTNNKLLKKKES